MKVGVITASFPLDTRAALRKAKELGAHGVQLWIVNNELEPRKLTRSGREDLKTYMAQCRRNVVMSGLSTVEMSYWSIAGEDEDVSTDEQRGV